MQAGGGVQLCPDAQVDDGKLDVTYILNPNLEDVPKILTGLQGAQTSSFYISLAQQCHSCSHNCCGTQGGDVSISTMESAVSRKPDSINAADKALEGPTGMLRCSWLEVDCPDELQVGGHWSVMVGTLLRDHSASIRLSQCIDTLSPSHRSTVTASQCGLLISILRCNAAPGLSSLLMALIMMAFIVRLVVCPKCLTNTLELR
jgi:hypothetical protein